LEEVAAEVELIFFVNPPIITAFQAHTQLYVIHCPNKLTATGIDDPFTVPKVE